MFSFRSYEKEEVSDDELDTLFAGCREPERMRKWIFEAGDLLVCDGDLEIPGDFSTFTREPYEQICGLVVKGSLRVGGCYKDFDDPRSVVVVRGDLEARDVWTSGELEVLGDVRVSRHLVGDYNDYGARFAGRVKAKLLFPEHHHFRMDGGPIEIDHAIGDPGRISSPPTARIPFHLLGDKELRHILRPGLFRWDEEYEEFSTDLRALHKELRKGEPILIDALY